MSVIEKNDATVTVAVYDLSDPVDNAEFALGFYWTLHGTEAPGDPDHVTLFGPFDSEDEAIADAQAWLESIDVDNAEEHFLKDIGEAA